MAEHDMVARAAGLRAVLRTRLDEAKTEEVLRLFAHSMDEAAVEGLRDDPNSAWPDPTFQLWLDARWPNWRYMEDEQLLTFWHAYEAGRMSAEVSRMPGTR